MSLPFVLPLFEVREAEPGVRIEAMSGDGEKCWTEYPESAGLINSYSDQSSD